MYIKNYICGHVVETVELEKINGCVERYRKLSKNEMIDTTTGEIIEVENSKSRDEQLGSLERTIRRLRMIINANFFGEPNELFITLTYRENMIDVKRLYSDFKRFYMRLKRRYKGYKFEYVNAIEPQLRGAWHIHLLLKAMNVKYLYIPNEEIAKLWGYGFTKTKRIESVDNIGAYLSAYLTNLEDGGKGARLYLYPSGVNIYRTSRGIKKPHIIKGDMGLDEKYKVYERDFEIKDGDDVVNRVTIKQYNFRRFCS